jgi:hypothetical protein
MDGGKSKVSPWPKHQAGGKKYIKCVNKFIVMGLLTI